MRGQVILFLPAFESGGVERNAVYFANAMVERGYSVHALFCRSTGERLGELDRRVDQVKIARLHVPFLAARIVDAASMLMFSAGQLARIRRAGPAVMVSFQSNVIAIALARLSRIPVAVRISNHFAGAALEGGLLRRIAEFGKRRFYRFADVVVANSLELAADYEPLLQKRVETIPNPVHMDRVRDLMSREVDEELFRHRRRPIVISVGRLAVQKNYALLLHAMREVVQEVPCDLVILGEGSERRNLESLRRELQLEPFVHLLGRRSDVYKYLARSDLFVLSSNYEGMPNALIEAVACGAPAVATRCKTGPSEILCNGEGGRLVPVDDHHALARAIISSLMEREDTERRRQVALVNIARYDYPKVTERYVGLVQELLAATGRRCSKAPPSPV